MTVVPESTALLDDGDAAIVLARYAQLVGYPECQFFGVAGAPGQIDPECRTIWLKSERDMVLKYLLEAQEELENHLRYPLKARWITDDERPYSCPVEAKWNKVIIGGVRAEVELADAEAVNHATDPAVVGPLAWVAGDEETVRVYHPGTDIEIHPSAIVIAGGNLTIYIPRCRMVTEAEADNPRTGLDYADLANFEATVDVTRVYNDPSTNAVLVWPHRCNSECSAACCSEYTKTGCIYVRNGELGILDVLPATYSPLYPDGYLYPQGGLCPGGSWSTTSSGCCLPGRPEIVRLNYKAGLTALSYQAEDAILRLAHAKMPEEPCGCDVVQRLWARDRNVPKIMTSERFNNPFGMNDGAWIAWRFAMDLKKVRVSVM